MKISTSIRIRIGTKARIRIRTLIKISPKTKTSLHRSKEGPYGREENITRIRVDL